MSPPFEPDSLLEDTVPQYVNQPPIEQTEQSPTKAENDGADATLDESPLELSTMESPHDRSDFESPQDEVDCSIQSSPGNPNQREQRSNSVTPMDEKKVGALDELLARIDEARERNHQPNQEIALSQEESLDYGCVPTNRNKSSPSFGSAEEDGSSPDLNEPASPLPIGAPHEGVQDLDDGPNDEQLRKAVRDIPTSVEDIARLTPKQALLMLEAQFSCSFKDRKKFIFRELAEVIRASPRQDATKDGGYSESEGHESDGSASAEARSSSSADERREASLADHASEDSGPEKDSHPSLTASCSGVDHPNDASEGDPSPLSSDAEMAPSAKEEAGRGSASSSESDADEILDQKKPSVGSTLSGLEADGDPPEIRRHRERGTPSPRTLTKRAMRGKKADKARRGVCSFVAAASSSSESDFVSHKSESESELPPTSLIAKSRRKRRLKRKNKETSSSPEDSSFGEEEPVKAPDATGSSTKEGLSSDSDENPSDRKIGKRVKKGKGQERPDSKSKKAPKRGPAEKTAVNRDNGGSALMNSDEEEERSKAKRPSSMEKAVVQEELDDVNEEKLKERKRIAAERQRQLDALRVMNAAQLKEVTRAQQGTLLAKIKERQAHIHAGMAAAAKEELKVLRAEARRVAGLKNDMEDEDDKEGSGYESPGVDGGNEDEMDVKDIVAKEEAIPAMASVAVGKYLVASGDKGPGVEEEEKEDNDFVVKATAVNKLPVKNTSRSPTNKKLEGGDGAGTDGDSSEEEDNSESDSELEILPASSTSALSALMRRRPEPSGALKSVVGNPPNATISKRSKEGSATAAARAIAALPKGMRFSLPKTADTVRAANRRRLATSARAVANDRWAAQLGYQDRQEHIRDLKYMELKRRQQAHRERERKAKENEAMEARLREYAANADAEEEEFGVDAGVKEFGADANNGKPSAPVHTSVLDAVDSGSRQDGKAVDESEHVHGDISMDDLVASIGGEGNIVDGPTCQKDNTDAMQALKSQECSRSGAHEEDRESNFGGVVARAASQEVGREAVGGESDSNAEPLALSTSGDLANTRRATEGDAAGVDRPDRMNATTAEVDTENVAAKNSFDYPTVLPVARPKIVRTYGRKKASEQDLVAATKLSEQRGTSDTTAKGSTDKMVFLSKEEPVVSPESQALWEEEPDSDPAALSGAGPECLGEESCGVSLNLFDEEDDIDESMRRPPSVSKDSVNAAHKKVDLFSDGKIAERELASVTPGRGVEVTIARVLEESSNEDVFTGGGSETKNAVSASGETDKANNKASRVKANEAAATSLKMKLAADGGLVVAPSHPSLPLLFKVAAEASSCSLDRLENTSTTKLPRSAVTKAKKGIVSFFGVVSDDAAKCTGSAQNSDSKNDNKDVVSSVSTNFEASAPVAGGDDDASTSLKPEVTRLVDEEQKDTENDTSRGKEVVDAGDENVVGKGENGKEEETQETGDEKVKNPKDRSAKFRAMLEADREANRRAKKLRKLGMVDEEAEEEEEEEAVRGLGDFGFGVPVGGTGTSVASGGGKKDDGDEEGVDEEIREEDLEGIVDTFSDDEGDVDAQDAFLKNQAAVGERQALKDMVRRVREGFGDERGGRGRGANARGSLRLDELTAADRGSRKEARRLGLLNSDEEWSDDEKGEAGGNEKDELDELDEVQLGELLAKEQRMRHMGLSQTAQDYLESSDSDGDEEGKGSGDARQGKAEEDADKREEDRIQKLWVKRAKRRRVLAEVEQSGTGNSQSRELLMQEDEDSQAILSLLHCTNSRLGVSGSVGGSIPAGGGGSAEATADAASGSSKRRARDRYAGELDSREVENGFGMGMSSKALKRAKSDGTEPKDVNPAEANGRMNRAFTMPQFVTSIAGYGSSTRAKQIQRKGSFLARSRSLHARSGSLAAGKTTVSASKFVFVSSVSGTEDTSARTGFEDPASRESSSGSGVGCSSNRPLLSASGANANREKAGVFEGIGEKRKVEGAGEGPEMGRLWKGLCANGKKKSRR